MFWKRTEPANDLSRGIDRAQDVLQATEHMGQGTPLGFDWHLDEDMVKLELVQSDVHRSIPHRGGWWARIQAGVLTPLHLGEANTAVTFHPQCTPIVADDLAAWERHHGVAIPGGPGEYRRLLLGGNGGVPSAPGLIVPGRPGVPPSTTIIKLFYGIGEVAYASIDWAVDLYGYRMPEGCLPIADDHCGNMVVLRVAGDRAGEVLFWDHEQEESDAGPLFPLASSFSVFMRALRV